MLCDICKKNEATIHIKEMHNNKWTSLNLCAECAKKNNLDAAGDVPQIDIAKMLVGLGKALEEQTKNNAAAKQNDAEKRIPLPDIPNCPICNWGVEDIQKNPGKLGCPACYTAFNEMIERTFKNIQKGDCHIGKRPKNAPDTGYDSYKYTLAILQKLLAQHVADENYEEAAKLRDAIERMKTHFAETGALQ